MYKQSLKKILDKSKINHAQNIMKHSSIKGAHIYCKINELSGQVSGPLIEQFIQHKFRMSKNNASDCTGDLRSNNKNIEIKMSNGGKSNNKFNYVQIRVNHECDYLLTAYYIDYSNIDKHGKLYMFQLTKSDIIPILFEHGHYAHGTIKKQNPITINDLNNCNNNKEYAIRPKYGDACWNKLLQFRVRKIRI